MDRSDPMFYVIAGLAIVVAILVLRDAWQQGLWRGTEEEPSKSKAVRKEDKSEGSSRKES